MTERFYRIAGLEFQFSMEPDLMFEKEYKLATFAVTQVDNPHCFQFYKAEKLEAPAGICIQKDAGRQIYQDSDCRIQYLGILDKTWENAYFRAEHCGKKHKVQLRAGNYPDRVDTRTVLESIELQHLILQAQGVVLHCSYIDHRGKAILFTAPSQTGKSTQADLWKKYRGADILNGDRAAVRIKEEKVIVEGIPFSGSSPYCENRRLPLEAIVYLGQAPVTTIRKLRGYEAFARMWEGISIDSWDRSDLEAASNIVKKIVETVPVYHMPCTPDEAAVITLEQELRKQMNV